MSRCAGSLIAVTLLVFVTGCPFGPQEPPAEAVLEGTWSVVPADPGSIENVTYEAVFDSNGQLTELTALRDDGATARLDTAGSVTSLDGSAVTISLQGTSTTTSLFEGTLSADQNTMIGSITRDIDLGDLEITLPGGELTFARIVGP